MGRGADGAAGAMDTDEMWPVFAAMGHGVARCTMIVDESGSPVDYRFDAVNELFSDMTGLVDPVGRTAHELVPGLEAVWVDTYARVALQRETMSFEAGSDVMGRWFEVFAAPLRAPTTFAMVFTDQTARHRAQLEVQASERRFRQLADELPVNVWFHDATGARVFVNQTFCDYFGVDRRVTMDDHWELPTHPDDSAAYVDELRDAVATGRPFVNRSRVRHHSGQWRWLESWASPRFDNDENYLGHLGASLDITERVLAEDERAALTDRERQGRRRAEILERHAARLAVVATRVEIAHGLIDTLDEAFGLGIAAVNLPLGDEIVVVAGRRVDPHGLAEYQQIALSDDLPGPIAIVENTELLLQTSADITERFARLGSAAQQYSIDTLYALPLHNQQRDALGAVVVGAPGERSFDADDLTLLRELAFQSGQALDRARLYEQLVEAHHRQRAVAVRLQEALLPDHLVEHPEVELHAEYAAADDALQVGGDWYDTFAWETGEIAVVVGDVVGHDLEAAARMGRLRAAAGALVPVGLPEASAILRALDVCARGPDGVDFVTAFAVVFDPRRNCLSYASAGHPPAVVVHLDGRAELLAAATMAPLGRIVPRSWPEVTVEFEPGATVVLYSDGLVEVPGGVITDGIDAVVRDALDRRHLPLDELITQLVDIATSHGTVRDDIIAIGLRSRS